MTDDPSNDSSNDFLGHMLKNQRRVRNYIFSLHPRSRDLDDLVQQTAMTLWREFHRFDTSREFLPWAMRIAYFEVLRLRKKQTRDRLVFSDELIEILAEDTQEPDPEPTQRALQSCLSTLDPLSREALLARYGEHETVADLATRRGVSVHRLYRLLDRARCLIVTCVRRRIYLGDEPATT